MPIRSRGPPVARKAVSGYGHNLRRERGDRLVIAKNHCITRNHVLRSVIFQDRQNLRLQHDGGLPSLRKDPLLTNLYDDPRWNAFLRTMGLADDQLK